MPRLKLPTRLATPEDAGVVAAIYNEGIAERNATFENEPRTAEQIVSQLGERKEGYDLQLTQYDERGWRATFYTQAWSTGAPVHR